jgi:hypothetical protein
MALRIDSDRSRVIVETHAKGMLASLAHDLRILAPVAGALEGESRCRATFSVRAMRVDQSCKHGSGAWGPPPASDRSQIEEKISSEVFRAAKEIVVEASLSGSRASLTIIAGGAKQVVDAAVEVARADAKVSVKGRARVSLESLGASQPKVPLGAIKLEDSVDVTFDVHFVEA